jgi:cyclase
MQELGVGEIILNDIDRDGTFEGYDLELIKSISPKLSMPLIACGGARNLDDFRLAIQAGASACAAGSMFVFHMPHRAVVISYPKYEDVKRLAGG